MKPRALLIMLLGLAVILPGVVSAQPGYMRKGYGKKDSSAASRKSKRKRSRRKGRKSDHGMPLKSGDDKGSIEVYLQMRLKALKKTQRAQGVYGRRIKLGWDKFWTKVYEDRKQFEIRLAKQRLNLFESLSSLEPSYHARTVSDFDRLQDTQSRSFEANLKVQMADYMSTLTSDLKAYGGEQEKARAGFMNQAAKAWRSQKAAFRAK